MPSVIFMGRKPGAVVALEHLLARGWDIRFVVTPSGDPAWLPHPTVAEVAHEAGLPLCPYQELLREVEASESAPDLRQTLAVEWVFCYLFPYRVRASLLDFPTCGVLNFHPAPLPDYGGLGGYNFAIMELRQEYGVTCHYMDEGFDTGDLVKVARFPMDPGRETALSLEMEAQRRLLSLFVEVTTAIEQGLPLPRVPQEGRTRYINRAQFEAAKAIGDADGPDMVARKARAFWFPPYDGAYMEVAGQRLTLVATDTLADIAPVVHGAALEDLRAFHRGLI